MYNLKWEKYKIRLVSSIKQHKEDYKYPTSKILTFSKSQIPDFKYGWMAKLLKRVRKLAGEKRRKKEHTLRCI